MMIALVLELNLLASSSWSRTQSALLILAVAVDFYRACQSSVMFHGNTTITITFITEKANLPVVKVLKQVWLLPFSP